MKNKYLKISLLVSSVFFLCFVILYTSKKLAFATTYIGDAVADNYMMEDWPTSEMFVPGTHTFFIKWPLFILMNWLGFNYTTYLISSVLLSVVTYTGFMFFVWIVTKKSIIPTAIISLILSCIILLMPPYPYAGAHIPIGIAMTTMRNIEFIFILTYLYLALNFSSLKSKRFILLTFLLSILILSDRLMFYYAFGGAVIFYFIRMYSSGKSLRMKNELLIILSTIISLGLSLLWVALLNLTSFVTLTRSTDISPLTTAQSVSQIWSLSLDTVQSVLKIYGIDLFNQALSIHILPSLFLGLTFIYVILACRHLLQKRMVRNADLNQKFIILILCACIFMIPVYVLSNHPGNGDSSRYLFIFLFGGLLALAYYITNSNITKRLKYSLPVIFLIFLMSILAVPQSKQNYSHAISAQESDYRLRYEKVITELKSNNIHILAGNFWTTYPIRFKLQNDSIHHQLSVAPIEKCNDAKPFFVNTAQYAVQQTTQSAIYLERSSFDNEIFNECEIEKIEAIYGQPEKRIPIRKTDNGKIVDTLLIYNYDVRSKINTNILKD